MHPDDQSLFLDAMEDVRPLKHGGETRWQPQRNRRAPQKIDTLQLIL